MKLCARNVSYTTRETEVCKVKAACGYGWVLRNRIIICDVMFSVRPRPENNCFPMDLAHSVAGLILSTLPSCVVFDAYGSCCGFVPTADSESVRQ